MRIRSPRRLLRPVLRACLGALLSSLPMTCLAAWTPIVEHAQISHDAQGVLLRDAHGALRVSALSPDIIRVRYMPGAPASDDPSFAVVNRDLGQSASTVVSEAGVTELRTEHLRVRITHDPVRLEFFDAAGRLLDADDRQNGMQRSGEAVSVGKVLREDEQVYGFGEKTGHLNKRGMGLGGYQYTMWNTDTYGYDSSTDPIYVSVPFYLVLRDGRAHGLFLDNSFRSHFDIGREHRERLRFGAESGELDYYFIDGPDPKAVLTRYTALTGRMPLPPLWSLGFHQCRWSYYPESRVRQLAADFRKRRMPADTLWLDIDYQDGFKPFVWNHGYFPDPKKLIGDLRQQGFHLVTIVDPHPKKEAGYFVYDQGVAGDHFVKNPDGSLFEGPVWPSGAKQNPGNSVFPDFTRSATRRWWGDLHKPLLDLGVAGIWNDMNEPAVWIAPYNTMPLDVRHDNDGHPTTQREIHNVYGMLHSRATFEGIARLKPDSRPFVLTRASFAGGQRYAAVWPGDNTADWSSLRQSLPMLLGMGLSGFSFVGADIGGFSGYPSGELFTRWLQAAVFSPFMRAHTEQSTPDQDPWSFGERYADINRRTLETRYQFLPQIYTVMEEASRTGVPAMRPLFLEFPDDKDTWSREDEYLFGSDLLVAPVLREGASEREVYLPAGAWYALADGARLDGGASHKLPVTLDSLPLFARAGAILFRQPTVQNTDAMRGAPLIAEFYPASQSSRAHYEDDGLSQAYRRGDFARRQFSQTRSDGSLSLSVSAVEGRYRPAPRSLELRVVAASATRVVLDGKPVARVDAHAFEAAPRAWTMSQGRVRVKWPDDARAHSVRLETR